MLLVVTLTGFLMTDPALYPLSKNTVTDLVETIISINSAGQKAYPKHYWGMNKTPKEIAEKLNVSESGHIGFYEVNGEIVVRKIE